MVWSFLTPTTGIFVSFSRYRDLGLVLPFSSLRDLDLVLSFSSYRDLVLVLHISRHRDLGLALPFPAIGILVSRRKGKSEISALKLSHNPWTGGQS